MNPIRVIALAAAHGVDPRSVGRATSGQNITPFLAAAMCTGMPDLWWSAARLRWAGDVSGVRVLAPKLVKFAREQAESEGWRVPKGRDYPAKMAELALLELADPRRYRFDTTRAAFLGMAKSGFSTTWKPRYEPVYQQLEAWCGEALRYINRCNAE